MSQDWQESSDDNPRIAHIQATPSEDAGGTYSKKLVRGWKVFCGWFSPLLRESEHLTEDYVQSKTAVNRSTVEEKTERAGEIAARTETQRSKTDLINQKATAEFIKNLESTCNLLPEVQPLALAKILDSNPGLQNQRDRVQEIYEKLYEQHGLRIGDVPPSLPAHTESDRSGGSASSGSDTPD